MNKWKKLNVIFFLILSVVSASLVYILGTMNFTSPFGKPWHLSPSVHEDSLSQVYLDNFVRLDNKSLLRQYLDSGRTNVFILVDAWGVPIQESKLMEEFSVFDSVPHIYALHQRLANRTKHAERVEFRNATDSSIYLFGGDSMEYGRLDYLRELGLKENLFCQHCSDSAMITKIDSILASDSLRLIAWTTQSSRGGNQDSLLNSLKKIAKFAKEHPEVSIVVQGTHRPVLTTSEIRNSYKSHWVPAVILNRR